MLFSKKNKTIQKKKLSSELGGLTGVEPARRGFCFSSPFFNKLDF